MEENCEGEGALSQTVVMTASVEEANTVRIIKNTAMRQAFDVVR